MNRITRIIKTFGKKEIHIIERYISSPASKNKKCLLFKVLKEDVNLKDEEISQMIFGYVSLPNLRKLEERLLKDIEDALLLNYGKINTGNTYEAAKSSVVTHLLLAQLFLERGLFPETHKKLKKAKKQIDEHNLIFLEGIYNQIYYDYLHRSGGEGMDECLKNSSDVLSELQYIQSLRLNGFKSGFSSGSVGNDMLPVINGNLQLGAYAKCLTKLSHIKFLIDVQKVDKADSIYRALVESEDEWRSRVPLELYVEILLQKVKINIAKGAYTDNLTFIESIRKLRINQEHIFDEFLKLRFLNFYALGHYDLCRNITFFFFSNNLHKANMAPVAAHQWCFFNLCLSFNKGQYASMLEALVQFPGYHTSDACLWVNVRITEIYLLSLVDRDEQSLKKALALKADLKEMQFSSIEHYRHVVDSVLYSLRKREGFGSCEGGEPHHFSDDDSLLFPDYLNLELITYNMFDAAMRTKKSKCKQIAY